MSKKKNAFRLIAGSPQFRLTETRDPSAPIYRFYGQAELEQDLNRLVTKEQATKMMRTNNQVNTLQENDLIFSLVSGKAAIVTASHVGYLFTQNYVKIVPPQTVAATYLVYVLNESSFIKRQLQIGLQGSMVMKYTIKQLRDLVLPSLPSLEKQRLIGDLYMKQLHVQALRYQVANLETTMLLTRLKEI